MGHLGLPRRTVGVHHLAREPTFSTRSRRLSSLGVVVFCSSANLTAPISSGILSGHGRRDGDFVRSGAAAAGGAEPSGGVTVVEEAQLLDAGVSVRQLQRLRPRYRRDEAGALAYGSRASGRRMQ
jgi:hypothetical protein